MRLAAERPVGRKQQQQIFSLAVPLPHLKHRLLARHDVAAVAVDEHDPLEAMKDEVLHQVDQHVEIGPRSGRKRAGKIEVMVGIAQPQQRRKQHAVANAFFGAAHHFAQQHAVGKHRHVAAVLFQRGHGKNNRRIFRQVGHLRPFEIGKLHGTMSGHRGNTRRDA